MLYNMCHRDRNVSVSYNPGIELSGNNDPGIELSGSNSPELK